MPSFEHAVEVDRPIEDVWDLWTDVRILPQLSSATTEVLDAPERLTRTGQTFRQIVRAVGRCFDVTWTVTTIEPLDHLTIEGSVGFGVRHALTERVEALAPSRTRLTIEVDYTLPFGPLGRVASKLGVEQLARRETVEILERLRALLHGAAAFEPTSPLGPR